MENTSRIYKIAEASKKASKIMALKSSTLRNDLLLKIRENILLNKDNILRENLKDINEGRKNGLSESFIDRLLLDENRIKGICEGIKSVVTLNDGLGDTVKMWKRPNGLEIGVKRVPLGLIAMIYEGRPNVTVDAAILAFKTGNAVILKGSKSTKYSNEILVSIIKDSLGECDFPLDCVNLADSESYDDTKALLNMNEYVDVLIPRGGKNLIDLIVKNATVPVIETGVGNCHMYVDEFCDLKMAVDILENGKTQRVSVCNSLETLLVHKNIKDEFFKAAKEMLKTHNVEIRGCEETLPYFDNSILATEDDYYSEFSDFILAVKVVDSLEEAVSHIDKYSSGHSEVIITNDLKNATFFKDVVDSACVYVNASTRFSDGEEFGFGAEIGISTQKLHARGPMGLEPLTSIKYIINGQGQIK